MNAQVKITSALLRDIRNDLARVHPFAHERVGFLTAGATRLKDGSCLLLAREYLPIDDADYLRDHAVGAMIGSEAMRKGLQRAYKTRSALLHIHTHGGYGRPDFSGIDVRENKKFVPGFFNALPQMPHGAIVLSADSARGMFWRTATEGPIPVTGFIEVGCPYRKFGGAHDLA